jgi:hypothetical protein
VSTPSKYILPDVGISINKVYQTQKSRFARAGGTNQSKDLTPVNPQVDVFQDISFPISLTQISGFD